MTRLPSIGDVVLDTDLSDDTELADADKFVSEREVEIADSVVERSR